MQKLSLILNTKVWLQDSILKISNCEHSTDCNKADAFLKKIKHFASVTEWFPKIYIKTILLLLDSLFKHVIINQPYQTIPQNRNPNTATNSDTCLVCSSTKTITSFIFSNFILCNIFQVICIK